MRSVAVCGSCHVCPRSDELLLLSVVPRIFLKLKLCLSFFFFFGKVFHRGLFLRCTSAELDLKTWIEKAEEETLANVFVTILKTLKNFYLCFIDRMTIKSSLSFLLGTSQQNSVQTRSINRAQWRLCCAQQKSVYGILVGILLETVVCLPRWLLLLSNNTLRNVVLLYGLVIKRALTKLTARTRATTFPTKLQWESRIPKLFLQTTSASWPGTPFANKQTVLQILQTHTHTQALHLFRIKSGSINTRPSS